MYCFVMYMFSHTCVLRLPGSTRRVVMNTYIHDTQYNDGSLIGQYSCK